MSGSGSFFSKTAFLSLLKSKSHDFQYHLSKLHRVSLLTAGVRGLHNRAEILRCLDHSLKSEDTAIDMMSEQQLYEVKNLLIRFLLLRFS